MADPRFPLVATLTTRDGTLTKDSLSVNCFREPIKEGVNVIKRPGLDLEDGFAAGKAQGMFQLMTVAYTIIEDSIIRIDTGTHFAIPATTYSADAYDIEADVDYTASKIAVIKSLRGMWIFDGTTVTKVIDAEYPAITVRGLVLVDGTYYVMDSDGIISGSAIENPTSWSALNFIGTDQSLGRGVRLFRHLNYCFALNDLGSQGFYDNSNPPPGSPLLPAGNACFLVGCSSADSVAKLDDLTIFIAKGQQRGRSVMALEGLSLVYLSTPFVDKILNLSSLEEVSAFGLKTAGHSFYILTLKDLNLTLVFDNLTKDWAVWTSTSGDVESYFKFGFYLNSGSKDFLQHFTSGKLYSVNPFTYTDGDEAISTRIRTLPYDGGTVLEKFFSAMNLIGDTVDTTVAVRYSNDDYQTWSTWRDVDMSSERKQLRNMGKARRRAFEFLHTGNTSLRLEAVEFDINLGNS